MVREMDPDVVVQQVQTMDEYVDQAQAPTWFALSLIAIFGAIALILAFVGLYSVLAYVVRFFAIAQGTADAALGRVPPSLPMAARSLGRTAGGTLRAVHVPLIRASVGSALLLVFSPVFLPRR